MGAASVLETAADTPPIKNSVRKVLMSFFFSTLTVASGTVTTTTGVWAVRGVGEQLWWVR